MPHILQRMLVKIQIASNLHFGNARVQLTGTPSVLPCGRSRRVDAGGDWRRAAERIDGLHDLVGDGVTIDGVRL